ncbi:MAG: ThuA domain-containing protein [Planctomycetaceae bacterium]|jgi:type 1 glutamine amidotransferase|nr:ThuA domain-containing protein [Planctomycetaceae bacterium]
MILRMLLLFTVVVGTMFYGQVDVVQGEESAAKIKTLIVDGQNNHRWALTTPVIKDFLEKSGRFTVDVATSPTSEEKKANPKEYQEKMNAFKPAFENYNLVVMNYNGDEWSAETKKSFEKFVADGGGLVIYHAANNSFPNWKEYNEMCAIGGWGGRNEKSGPYLYIKDGKPVLDPSPGPGGHHGPQWEYLIEVQQPEHPIMKGLPKKFRHAKDELYDMLRGPAKNVTILATAFADKEKGGTGRDEPLLLVIDYGKGRVFHTCLGDNESQCKSVSFIITFLRGAEWAATGNVTIPVPDDMPGTDKPVFRQ